jgi:predicted permease
VRRVFDLWLDVLACDVRYAARSLALNWGFTLGAGAVLALGIGANTAIFSVVNSVLMRPLAYADADRIVSVETLWTHTGRPSPDVSGPDFLDWQAQTDVVEAMGHFRGEDDMATVIGGRGEFANVRWVSPQFFEVFGQPPAAGRFIGKQDESTGQGPASVAVMAHHLAVKHFGSAQGAIGRVIAVYGRSVEVVGVTVPGFRYPGTTDIWTADGLTDTEERSGHSYNAVGKLRAGVSVVRGQDRMRTIAEGIAQKFPENRFKSVSLIPLQSRLTGNVRGTLWVLMGAVVAVLMIACANIANLLLARAASRTREMALRAALGAGRGRVIRQLLTESFVLSGLAAIAGVIVASVLLRALVAMAPANLPRIDEVAIDTTVLLFATGLTIVSALIFGLVPALSATRLDLAEALKVGGKGAIGGDGRMRAALVVAEVALSVMLLTASGLFLRSFQVLNAVDLGFTTERVLVAYTQYVANNPKDRAIRVTFYRNFLDRVRAVPGVISASGVAFLPMGREPRPEVEYFVQGRPEEAPGKRAKAEYQSISTDYFKTLGIPFREGRDFSYDLDAPGRPRAVIVNETLARAAFPNGSAIGQRIRQPDATAWMEIVGVVGDMRWRDPSARPPAEMFVSATQGGGSLSIVARTTVDPISLSETFRRLMHEVNPAVPVRVETMDELFSSALAYPRFRTELIGAFAATAALLAAVGIFSVLAYLVGQRTKELAVRRAVGANAVDVIRLIVGQGFRLVAAGLVLGVLGALAVSRSLEDLLYEVSPWDVRTYAAAIAVLAFAALLATLLPAVRAVRIDPLTALRHE